MLGRNAGAGVGDAEGQGVRPLAPSSHRDAAAIATLGADGIHAVENEVEQHLLQLYPVAAQPRQIRRRLDLERDMAGRRIRPHQGGDIVEHLRHVEGLHLDLLASQQRAHIRSMTAPAR